MSRCRARNDCRACVFDDAAPQELEAVARDDCAEVSLIAGAVVPLTLTVVSIHESQLRSEEPDVGILRRPTSYSAAQNRFVVRHRLVDVGHWNRNVNDRAWFHRVQSASLRGGSVK